MPYLESRPRIEQDVKGEYFSDYTYATSEAALDAYGKAQTTIFQTANDLSAYRLRHLDAFHVVVLGEKPPKEVGEILSTALSGGMVATLPEDIRSYLFQRRNEAKKIGPWVEGHYRPGKDISPLKLKSEISQEGELFMRVWNNSDYILQREAFGGLELEEVVRERREFEEEGRKIRLGQVLRPEQLVAGQRYELRHTGQPERDYSITVTGQPYEDNNRRMVVDVRKKFGKNSFKTKVDLGDYGVIPVFELWTTEEYEQVKRELNLTH